MTIVLPDNAHAQAMMESNNIPSLLRREAIHQNIRPLRIGILNIMPHGEKYEFNLLHPLGLSIIQIDPVWIRLNSHSYKTSNQNHIDDLYVSYEEAISEQELDSLIVTGAPIEHLPFEEVRYWDEISEILLAAKKKYPSTLGICWGALALAYLEGIVKVSFPQKKFGVFEIKNLDPHHPITGSMDDMFWCPLSTHAGIEDQELEKAQADGRVNLLGYNTDSGYVIFETTDHRYLMHTGHPEYNSQRLAFEAERDKDNPEVPPCVNFDFNKPVNNWRSHRNSFFTQWLKYCYMKISMD
ncbi:MAG: homoserine O-succinyltransferase [SAR324 cluster bacterium]|nr:homoserine O-succinyltransferase [SAR324 cluster bacterium]